MKHCASAKQNAKGKWVVLLLVAFNPNARRSGECSGEHRKRKERKIAWLDTGIQ